MFRDGRTPLRRRIDDEPDQTRALPPWLKIGGAVVAGVGLLAVLWSVWDGNAVRAWKEDAPPLPFFVAMALLPAIGMPLTPFLVLASATFGLRVGLIGSAAALAVNLVLCYWVAQTGLRPRLEALLRKSSREIPDFHDGERSAWRFTLLVKFAPGVPAFVKNYALGLARVPFGQYFGASMAITGAYGASILLLGDSLLEHNRTRTAWLTGAGVLLAVGVWIWRRRQTTRTIPA